MEVIKYQRVMEYKLPQFDQTYDGYFSIANKIINIQRESQNFTLDCYDGKQQYIDDHINKFNEILSLIDVNKLGKQDTDTDTIHELKHTLLSFGGKCKPSYFVYSYLQLMVIASHYTKEQILYQAEDLFTSFLSFDKRDIKQSLLDFDRNFPNLVPFISSNGYFGINTFLFLFFNNMYPVGISSKPISAHGQRYKLPLDVSLHDVHHYYYYHRFLSQQLLVGHDQIFDHICESKAFSADYFDRMKVFYHNTVIHSHNHNTCSLDRKKFRLICLFFLIHEVGEQFTELECHEKRFYEEELRTVYHIPSYSPLGLGYTVAEDTSIKEHIFLPDYLEFDIPQLVEGYINDLLVLFDNEMRQI